MRTITITRFGPPEVLKVVEEPTPNPKADEVLVRVKAVGLNFADIMARVGVYPAIPEPPFVPGLEFSGVVETVGSEVKRIRKGDRVMGLTRLGAYAEAVCVRAVQLFRLPKSMSFVEAAAFGVSYLTAYHGLVTLSNLRQSERVLIHAAAGGVGTASIQLAKHYGAEVYGTASADWKLNVAEGEGADHCINYEQQDFERIVRELTGGNGVEVVMDSVGGRLFRKGWRLLAPMGRYVLYGFASIAGPTKIRWIRAMLEFLSMPPIYPWSLVGKNRALFGFNLYFLGHKSDYIRSSFQYLLELYGKRKLKPVVGRTFPFDEAAAAHRYLQSRESYGKVVLVV